MTNSTVNHTVNDESATTQVGAEPGSTVLVVDDSATVRAYHGSILSNVGFEVREAGNGYEALELALSERFGLMLVDINMPVMDGYALVAEVRRASMYPEVPIIMISTEGEESDSAEAYRNGANVYLVKPADPEQLVTMAQMLTGAFDRRHDGPT